MKKLFTLLFAASLGSIAIGQTVFTSNLSSWNMGDPTDFMGPNTSIASSSVVQTSTGANFGSDMAALINSTTSHKRFTTESTAVVGGTTYTIKIWVSGNTGELRTNYYDETDGTTAGYGTYNSYVTISGAQTIVSQSVTVPSTCNDAQFILSLRNTDATGILVDSVSVTAGGTTPPPTGITSIYDIQFTTNTNGDSPEVGNVVTTKGVVTAYINNTANFGGGSFFIQDGNGSWNGLYIYNLDTTRTPFVGDSVEVTGTVIEHNLGSAPENVTELGSVTNVNVINSGNTLPSETIVTTGAANREEYEGVLIKVVNAEATSVGSTLGFGLWEMNDGSGALKGDDDMYAFHTQAILGSDYDVTGIGHYSFDDYKILPRKTSDVALFTGVDELSGVKVVVYPNPVKGMLNFKLDVNGFNVQIIDVTGKTVRTENTINNKLTVNTENLNNGFYFYSISDVNGNLISTNKFIVAK
ncbi:MAG: T9SS type A sorting domain-containing protein [Vicingaceae bacterium]|nr:T9SS type A sorting domain-containing protein [Vicingaceae bacterium]